MTKNEWDLINCLASQLAHFRDRDGLQMADEQLDDLLDKAELCLDVWRPILKQAEWRGQSASLN